MPNIFDRMARAKTDTKIALLLSTLAPALLAYFLKSNILGLIAFVYSMVVYIPIYLAAIAPPDD
jgi:uncharacterized membrane protein YhhN